jgi:CxxC-x17-CxxC domain-containing protein
MPFEEKSLTCVECGKPFAFTVEEQEFHEKKGYKTEPKRCPACREMKRSRMKTGGGGHDGGGFDAPRQMHETTCSACGGKAEVPFKPRLDRPVYCNDCFAKMKGKHGDDKGSH